MSVFKVEVVVKAVYTIQWYSQEGGLWQGDWWWEGSLQKREWMNPRDGDEGEKNGCSGTWTSPSPFPQSLSPLNSTLCSASAPPSLSPLLLLCHRRAFASLSLSLSLSLWELKSLHFYNVNWLVPRIQVKYASLKIVTPRSQVCKGTHVSTHNFLGTT